MESKTEKNKTFVDSVVAVLHDTTLNLSQRKDEVQKIMDEVEASKSLVKIGDFELDDIKVDSLQMAPIGFDIRNESLKWL